MIWIGALFRIIRLIYSLKSFIHSLPCLSTATYILLSLTHTNTCDPSFLTSTYPSSKRTVPATICGAVLPTSQHGMPAHLSISWSMDDTTVVATPCPLIALVEMWCGSTRFFARKLQECRGSCSRSANIQKAYRRVERGEEKKRKRLRFFILYGKPYTPSIHKRM